MESGARLSWCIMGTAPGTVGRATCEALVLGGRFTLYDHKGGVLRRVEYLDKVSWLKCREAGSSFSGRLCPTESSTFLCSSNRYVPRVIGGFRLFDIFILFFFFDERNNQDHYILEK